MTARDPPARYADSTDEQLVSAARAGDRDAFSELLTRHRPLLLALCRRALPLPDVAEDASQEAMLRAWLNLDRLRQPTRFGPWLAGIGLHTSQQMRQREGIAALSWEAMVGGSHRPELVDTGLDPHDLIEAAELRQWVARVVDRLPPGQRAAVVLHYLAELSQAETARTLGIRPGAVKTRLHKARAALRSQFAEHDRSQPRSGGRLMHMVEMRVVDVLRRVVNEGEDPRHVAVLDDHSGERRLLIWMGQAEATALALSLAGKAGSRPMTYAFAASLLQAAGGRCVEARIDRLDGQVFIATVVVDGPQGRQEIDARPSDAINFSMLAGVPIFVSNEVLAEAGEPVVPVERPEIDHAAVIVAEVLEEWSRHV